MSLNPETVEITLGSDTYVLVPNLNAATAVSNTLNGPLAAIEGLRGFNLNTMAAVIAAGASLDRKEANTLPGKIFGADQDAIAAQCLEFCFLLMNGGKKKVPEGKSGKKQEAKS